MIHEQTLDKLRGLRLTAMADALATQASHPDVQSLSFEERLGLLVDQEWAFRDNRRLAAYFGPNRPPVSAQIVQSFRRKSSTDFGRIRPAISDQIVHP